MRGQDIAIVICTALMCVFVVVGLACVIISQLVSEDTEKKLITVSKWLLLAAVTVCFFVVCLLLYNAGIAVGKIS